MQSYELAGVTSVLLDAKARQQDNLLQIGSNSIAFNVHIYSDNDTVSGAQSTHTFPPVVQTNQLTSPQQNY